MAPENIIECVMLIRGKLANIEKNDDALNVPTSEVM
jgi:hypothetical protein